MSAWCCVESRKGADTGEPFLAPCSWAGLCTAPLLPSPLCDASCPGTVTIGSQLCPVSSATNKCCCICSHLLLAFALQRHRATGSPSVPVPDLGWAVLVWPWLALPVPKPSAGSLLGGTGLAPCPGPAWPCLASKDGRALPVPTSGRAGPGSSLHGVRSKPLCTPVRLGATIVYEWAAGVCVIPGSLVSLEQPRAGCLAGLRSVPPLPRPPRWRPETLGCCVSTGLKALGLVPCHQTSYWLGTGAWPAPACLLGWGAPACTHRPTGQRG